MEQFFTAAVIWFIIGFVLFLLEFIVPGLILFFFGLGAWIVALILVFTGLSVNMQLVIFLLSSGITLILFRKWTLKRFHINRGPNEIHDEFVGKTAKAETFIGPTQPGKVEFNGTLWNASSSENIEKGETVIIISMKGISLFVKSTKN
jgi:inner membrane protein